MVYLLVRCKSTKCEKERCCCLKEKGNSIYILRNAKFCKFMPMQILDLHRFGGFVCFSALTILEGKVIYLIIIKDCRVNECMDTFGKICHRKK